jgi:uncharacterized protein
VRRRGMFDRKAGDYRRIDVSEQCEVLSLIGDTADAMAGRSSLHFGARMGTTIASVSK